VSPRKRRKRKRKRKANEYGKHSFEIPSLEKPDTHLLRASLTVRTVVPLATVQTCWALIHADSLNPRRRLCSLIVTPSLFSSLFVQEYEWRRSSTMQWVQGRWKRWGGTPHKLHWCVARGAQTSFAWSSTSLIPAGS